MCATITLLGADLDTQIELVVQGTTDNRLLTFYIERYNGSDLVHKGTLGFCEVACSGVVPFARVLCCSSRAADVLWHHSGAVLSTEDTQMVTDTDSFSNLQVVRSPPLLPYCEPLRLTCKKRCSNL